MAIIGQIIYNVIDFNNKNGFISTKKDDISIIISSINSESTYEEDKINIFNDLVFQINKSEHPLKKIGIQAPPGTHAILNDNKDIIIGRTGIYELDEPDIFIKSIYFKRPSPDKDLHNIILDYIY